MSTHRIPLTPAVRRLVLIGTLWNAVVPVMGLLLFGLLSFLILRPTPGRSSGAEEGAALMRIVLPIIGAPLLLAVAILCLGWIRDLRAASYLRTIGPVRTFWQWGYGGGRFKLEFGAGQTTQLPTLGLQLRAFVGDPIPRMHRGVVDHTEHRRLILAVLDEHGAVLYSRRGYKPPPVSGVLIGS